MARSVSAFGDSLALVALIVYVAETVGAAFAVAGLLLVGELIPSAAGPVQRRSDRSFRPPPDHRAQRTGQAVAVLLIAVTLPSTPLLLMLVAVQALAGQVLQPAARSVIPVLLPDRHLEPANAAIGFGANGMEAIGPFAAAALIDVAGVRAVLLIDVATFVLSAGLLIGLRPLPAAARDGHRHRIVADVVTELRFMATAPLIRAVALGFVAVVICNGVDDVALLFLVRDSFQDDTSTVGIGLLVGYLILGRRGTRTPMAVLFLLGCAVSSLGNLLTGVACAMAAAFTLQLLRGCGTSLRRIR